jgi:hypothetical protein
MVSAVIQKRPCWHVEVLDLAGVDPRNPAVEVQRAFAESGGSDRRMGTEVLDLGDDVGAREGAEAFVRALVLVLAELALEDLHRGGGVSQRGVGGRHIIVLLRLRTAFHGAAVR